MVEEFMAFHFLRPWWLLLIPIVILLVYFFGTRLQNNNSWAEIIDPRLLHFLSTGHAQQQYKRMKNGVLALATIIGIIALAGPSWQQIPLPVFEKSWSRVFVMDLSLSMDASDLKPSRLARAKYKLQDMLGEVEEGEVALVAYAGDAFVISPLTPDTNTVQNLVPALQTNIMPVLGSRVDLALLKANELLENNAVVNGEIIVITDGVDNSEVNRIQKAIDIIGYPMQILTVGTTNGAPIPIPGRGFFKDEKGNVVLPRLDLEIVQKAFQAYETKIYSIQNDASDIKAIIQHHTDETYEENKNIDQESDQWVDMGQYLMLILLPFCLFLFHRRGQVIAVLIAFSYVGINNHTYAKDSALDSFNNLWLNNDKKAEQQFADGNHQEAAELFENTNWKAAANYKAGNFEAALDHYQQGDTANDFYNAGNALAKLERYEEAIQSYQEALDREPDFAKASSNKKLIEDLLNNQQQSQEQQSQQQNQQGQEQQSQEQQSQQQNQQGQEQQSQEQQTKAMASEQDAQQEGEPDERIAPVAQPLEGPEMSEQERKMQKWLNKIPDDPSGLLRQKMYLEAKKRRRQQGEKKKW